MKLIIGFGNPGTDYVRTRHNVGSAALEFITERTGDSFTTKSKLKSDIASLTIDGEKVLLVKSQTFYNNVGEAASLVANFYHIEPSDVLVVHDELALPFGTIRTRQGGSDAGNNGIKSLNTLLGPNTARIRVGVYNETRDRRSDADFVLSRFTKNEHELLPELFITIEKLVRTFVTGEFNAHTVRHLPKTDNPQLTATESITEK